jgi:hypothetical protein
MDEMVKKWLNQQEKHFKSLHLTPKKIEKGWKTDERISTWNEELYHALADDFKNSPFLYCYKVEKLNGKDKIHYIDFQLNHRMYRFYFFCDEDKTLNWRIIIKNEEIGTFFQEFRNIEKEEMELLYEKVQKIISTINQMPSYRVKLAIKELTLGEEEEENLNFFECLRNLDIIYE